MKKATIKFERPVLFTGRNGTATCSGLDLVAFEDNTITIHPITSKNKRGNCAIEIPMELAAQVAHHLLVMAMMNSEGEPRTFAVLNVDKGTVQQATINFLDARYRIYRDSNTLREHLYNVLDAADEVSVRVKDVVKKELAFLKAECDKFNASYVRFI